MHSAKITGTAADVQRWFEPNRRAKVALPTWRRRNVLLSDLTGAA